MPSYRVVWEIDIEADTPQDAAQQALDIQRDGASIATVFQVRETRNGHVMTHVMTKGRWWTIDLKKEDNS